MLKVDAVNDSTLTKDIKKYVMEYLVNKYEPTDMQNILNKASYLDPRFCDMYLDDDAKDTVKQMATEEGEVLLSSLNLSVSDSEHAAINNLRQKSENLVLGLKKQDLVVRMMNRGSCHWPASNVWRKKLNYMKNYLVQMLHLIRLSGGKYILRSFLSFPCWLSSICVSAHLVLHLSRFSAPLDTLFLSEGLALSQIKLTC